MPIIDLGYKVKCEFDDCANAEIFAHVTFPTRKEASVAAEKAGWIVYRLSGKLYCPVCWHRPSLLCPVEQYKQNKQNAGI